MRALRLALPCMLIALALTVAPAHSASGDEPDGGNLLNQLVKNVTGAATADPAPTSARPNPSPEPSTPKSTSPTSLAGESSEDDVSASALEEAVDDSYTVPAGQSTMLEPRVIANDNWGTSELGPVFTRIDTNPTHGTLQSPDGFHDIVYTPNPGFVGTDSFTYHFDTFDGSSNSATVTLTVTAAPPPPAPIAADDSYTVPPDQATLLTPDVTANDTGTASLTLVTTNPAHGSVTTTAPFGHDFTYTPDPGYVGPDSFQYNYLEQDTNQVSNIATVTLTVTAAPPPPAPIAADDSYTVPSDQATLLTPDVTANDTGTASLTLVTTSPAHGSVTTTVPFGHDFTYTPDPGYVGPDSFQYSFLDEGTNQVSNIATVSITVAAAPAVQIVANDDFYTVQQDSGQTTLTVQSNDSHPAAATLDEPSDPAHGTVSIKEGPNQAYYYTPDPGFSGTDTFTYSYHLLADTSQKSNTATVTITVTPTGDPERPGDDGDDGDEGDEGDEGKDSDVGDGDLPDTGAPRSNILALGLMLMLFGVLLIRPYGPRRLYASSE